MFIAPRATARSDRHEREAASPRKLLHPQAETMLHGHFAISSATSAARGGRASSPSTSLQEVAVNGHPPENVKETTMTQHACEPAAGGPIKALLATHRPAAADKEWADVTASAAGALTLWRRQRHTHVFADFGPLACGTTGLQLARRMRAEDPNVLVFLLSDGVNPTQALWARSSGAFAVVPRDRKSIAACLSGWTLHSCHGQHLNGMPFDKTMQEARRIMISNLLSLGQMSPDSLSAVERAVAALGRLNVGATASAADMARAVAQRIAPREQYPAFLKWFTQAIPTNARSETPQAYRLAGSMLQRAASGSSRLAAA